MSTVFHNCVPEKVHMALVFFSFLSLSRTFKFARTKAAHFLSTQIFSLFWIPKNCPLNQATQKNTCQNFPTQKIPESKISNQKPFLRSSPSLASHADVFGELVFHPSAQTPTQPKTTFLSHCFIWPINSCEIKCWQAKHN